MSPSDHCTASVDNSARSQASSWLGNPLATALPRHLIKFSLMVTLAIYSSSLLVLTVSLADRSKESNLNTPGTRTKCLFCLTSPLAMRSNVIKLNVLRGRIHAVQVVQTLVSLQERVFCYL